MPRGAQWDVAESGRKQAAAGMRTAVGDLCSLERGSPETYPYILYFGKAYAGDQLDFRLLAGVGRICGKSQIYSVSYSDDDYSFNLSDDSGRQRALKRTFSTTTTE